MRLFIDSVNCYWFGSEECGVVCLGESPQELIKIAASGPGTVWPFSEATELYGLRLIGKDNGKVATHD